MKIVDTEYLFSSPIKEEVKHTFQVTQDELKEFEKALSLIRSYEKLVITSEVVSSDWRNIEFKVDEGAELVYAVVRYGMEG